jgi:hypothetical protein
MTWSKPATLIDSLSPVLRLAEGLGVFVGAHLVTVNGRLYGYGSSARITGWTDGEETVETGDPNRYMQCVHRHFAGIACCVGKRKGVGAPFWLTEDPVPGFEDMPCLKDQNQETRDDISEIAAGGQFSVETPTKQYMNDLLNADLAPGAPEFHLCEPTAYRSPDGKEICLFRDHRGSLRLFATVREPGQAWPKAVITEIPDSMTHRCVGHLADGRVFMIGNHIPKRWARDPLTLTVSPDGYRWDSVWTVRCDCPPVREPGWHKGHGFQYPDAVTVKEHLLVAYSLNKEDIGVSMIPLNAIAPTKTEP